MEIVTFRSCIEYNTLLPPHFSFLVVITFGAGPNWAELVRTNGVSACGAQVDKRALVLQFHTSYRTYPERGSPERFESTERMYKWRFLAFRASVVRKSRARPVRSRRTESLSAPS